MSDATEPAMSREQLREAMLRDAEGMRGLQQFLAGIKDLDDAAFAEATDGADRTETMQLLDQLNHLLSELDQLTAQMHPDVN
jgi:hypothetical protein